MEQSLRIIKCIVITIIIGFTYDVYAAPIKTTNTDQFYKKIQQLVKNGIHQYNIPGMVLSIKLPNEQIHTFSAGLRDVAKNKPLLASQLFLVGSITKSFTSAITLQLQQDGKLKIDDKLSAVARAGTQLNKLTIKYPKLHDVTIRQLLNHNSGLPAATNSIEFQKRFNEDPFKTWSDRELLNLALKNKSYFKPGTKGKYHYTNTDYILAGLVIESVTGKPFSKSMRSLFKKANLSDIYYVTANEVIPKTIDSRLPQSYVPLNSDWPDLWMKTFARFPKVMLPGIKPLEAFDVSSLDVVSVKLAGPAGGIITNSVELVKWYQALFQGKQLTRDSLQQMLDTIPTGSNRRYGLGVGVSDLPQYKQIAISHTGTMFGYKSNVIYLTPANITIAITTNSQSASVDFSSTFVKQLFEQMKTYGIL